MITPKQAAKQLLEDLPDQASWDDIMYKLYIKEKIEAGLADIKAGRTISHEQLKAELLNNEN